MGSLSGAIDGNGGGLKALDYLFDYGEGTAYTLTTSPAILNFGTSGDLKVTVAVSGTYIFFFQTRENLSAITASAAANYTTYTLRRDGVIASVDTLGTRISVLASAIVGAHCFDVGLYFLIDDAVAGEVFSIYGKKQGSTTGAWTLDSDNTQLLGVRIA